MTTAHPQNEYDVIVVGAGISGVYTLYTMRQAGLKVRLLEAGGSVGGTWYWNRYPGCRFDLESHGYAYFFSKELVDDWVWSEEYAAQPETERYLNHVLDRFDLRQHIDFNARVASMAFDDETTSWLVTTEQGATVRSRFVITAVGILSAPIDPKITGRDRFTGEQYHTALWPDHTVELAGKRVAVIGTGSSGVQLIQTIAPDVASMVVFQRTPNWCTPLSNRAISPERSASIRAKSADLYEALMSSGPGSHYRSRPERAVDVSPEERQRVFEELYDAPGMAMVFANFSDVMRDAEANDLLNEFLAGKIRERVTNPEVAEKLIPTDHGYGQKRPPMEIGYYEAFNQDNVTLVSTHDEPIVEITEMGISTSTSTYDIDVIIYATGFEAVTGSFNRIDIRGLHDTLKEHWEGGPRTHLGILTAGFPNFLMVGGPQSTTGNIPRFAEMQTNWIADLLSYMRDRNLNRVETTPQAEDSWSDFVYSTIKGTLQEKANSWAWGTNVPGKKRTYLLYGGGIPRYREELDAVMARGYEPLALHTVSERSISAASS